MNLSRHTYLSTREKVVHAVLGIILFVILNLATTVLLVMLSLSSPSTFFDSPNGLAAYGLTVTLLNIALLIYFGFTRYWIALGALVICSIWFLVVLLLAPQCFGLGPTLATGGIQLPSLAN